MPIIIVDVPTITLTLVGPVIPQSVQIAMAGLTPGYTVLVTGQAGSYTWTVRGGNGTTITADQLILTDAATPLNIPVTYTVSIEQNPFTAGPITVPYLTDTHVLQSLDGRTVVPFHWFDNDDPRVPRMRSRVFEVAGRTTPVGRFDVSAGESGELSIRTTATGTAALLSHLQTAGPNLLLRTDGTVRDLPAVAYIFVMGAPRKLWAGVEDRTARVWTLDFEVITDPEPDQILPTSTWADFDAAWVGRTSTEFDTEMFGVKSTDFDRIDWTQYA
jgi:hypothetical protein